MILHAHLDCVCCCAGARGGLGRKWALEQRGLERELSQDELRAVSESVEKQVRSRGAVAVMAHGALAN